MTDVLVGRAALPARPDDLGRAREIVAGYQPPDPAQADVQARVLDFIDRHDDALHRSCGPGHLTGSALVVEDGTGRVLLLFHTKLQRWLQPGGHADGDGELAGVALREAVEETGIGGLLIDPTPIDLDVHPVAPPGEAPHEHLDVRFGVLAPAGSVPRGNHESEALRWVEPDQLVTLDVDDSILRLAAAARRRAG